MVSGRFGDFDGGGDVQSAQADGFVSGGEDLSVVYFEEFHSGNW